MAERRRSRPPRARFALRRLVAFVLVGGAAAALVWLAAIVLADEREEPPAASVPTAPRPPRPLRIVFPEGFTREQMAARITAVNEIAKDRRGVTPSLSERAYLTATARSRLPGRFAGDGETRSLEGFLFPATYEFTRRTTSRQLVRLQLKAFRRNWSRVDLRYARSKNLTPYDVLIIASMVEEEVRAASERRLVAAVIYNRLRADMKLGIDATIRYALGVSPTESLRLSQLEHRTPYNTRLYRGLPPTPIANPGLASIRAAANPANVDYLYFVRKPDKVHHFFTASHREFENYKQAHGYG